MTRYSARLLGLAWLMALATGRAGENSTDSPPGLATLDDPRVREVPYAVNAVYHLAGRIGYQIDIEFEAGERYLGLAAGDVNGLSFEAQDNHVFLKPKAASVITNLTILTDRRHYYFDYVVSANRAAVTAASDTIYALRFRYSQEADRPAGTHCGVNALDQALDNAVSPINRLYGYCGSRYL